MPSWLFVPGHDAHKVQKALRSSAEVVIIDWEDAVPADRKADARATTQSLLSAVPLARRWMVRINAITSADFAADFTALTELSTAGVLLPKVDHPDDVRRLANNIDQPIIPLLESALGIELAFEIAKAHARIERLSFGPLDFLADIGGQWTHDNAAYHYARARVSIAGRAAGLAGAIDGVYPNLDDDDGLRRDAAGARAVGCVGKMVIHPRQIAIVHEVFSPTAAEVREAREIIQAFEEARLRGAAAIRIGGRFIDPPVVRWAQQVLALHEASGVDQLNS